MLPRPRHAARLVLALSAGALAFVSCDGGDGSPPAPLRIEALDVDFDADRYTVPEGDVAVEYVQEGELPHTLLIADVDGFLLEVHRPGQVSRGTVSLDAGTYELFCDVPGHVEAGMVASLVVE